VVRERLGTSALDYYVSRPAPAFIWVQRLKYSTSGGSETTGKACHAAVADTAKWGKCILLAEKSWGHISKLVPKLQYLYYDRKEVIPRLVWKARLQDQSDTLALGPPIPESLRHILCVIVIARIPSVFVIRNICCPSHVIINHVCWDRPEEASAFASLLVGLEFSFGPSHTRTL